MCIRDRLEESRLKLQAQQHQVLNSNHNPPNHNPHPNPSELVKLTSETKAPGPSRKLHHAGQAPRPLLEPALPRSTKPSGGIESVKQRAMQEHWRSPNNIIQARRAAQQHEHPATVLCMYALGFSCLERSERSNRGLLLYRCLARWKAEAWALPSQTRRDLGQEHEEACEERVAGGGVPRVRV
eukprot:TRINITY_DN13051_c0_g1_i2.p1 TRINITY_DN13051_c0_g1~~TRINITY_DN13051_c0_g1_i2.p1  ORF type:complete len:183 (-),score=25.73 TRINITY_DN13051_c0_g1_i2:56-604(-)